MRRRLLMGPESFDALSRAAGRTASRRRALALIAGTAAAAFTVPQFLRKPASAGTGGTGGGTKAGSGRVGTQSFECSMTNFPVLDRCEDLNEYGRVCGSVCPDGQVLPYSLGCTYIAFHPEITRQSFPETWEDPLRGEMCARQFVTVNWKIDLLSSAVTHPIIRTPACCQDACDDTVRTWVEAAEKHEEGHRIAYQSIIAQGNVEWTDKVVMACGGTTPESAKIALRAKVGRQIDADYRSMRQQLDALPEPFIPPEPDCGKCQPKPSKCSQCVDNTCQGCASGRVCCETVPFLCCDQGWTCCPDPANQGQDGCCLPGHVCCAFDDGGGCCPSEAPFCYIHPIFGPACSDRPVDARAAGGTAPAAGTRGRKPVAQQHARNRGPAGKRPGNRR
jgi:hypothetical protein